MPRTRTTWKPGDEPPKPKRERYPAQGPGNGPPQGEGWGGPASGKPAHPEKQRHIFGQNPELDAYYNSLRGTPEGMAKTALRNHRRDIAAATVFDVLVDSPDPFVKLAAAKDIQDRVDGKPMVRQEITGKDGAPLVDYRKLPPDVLTMLNEALDKAEAMVGHCQAA